MRLLFPLYLSSQISCCINYVLVRYPQLRKVKTNRGGEGCSGGGFQVGVQWGEGSKGANVRGLKGSKGANVEGGGGAWGGGAWGGGGL